MKQLNEVLKVIKFFEEYARYELRNIKCSTLTAKISHYNEAETRIEDGGTFHYPETIDVSFYSWSTSHYSYRLSDARWIRESADLNGKGISTFRLMRRLIKEIKAYKQHCELHHEARQTNSLVFNGSLVPCENIDSRDFLNRHGLEAVFKITTEDGFSSNWYGYNAEDALHNAAPFLSSQPALIALNHFRDRYRTKYSIKHFEALTAS